MMNISFNNKNYTIDREALSDATNGLKSHLSTTMNGSGATVSLDGVSYNIDSAKLATAKNEFVSHLGTIAGSGHKVVIDGVEYGIDSAKVQVAIDAFGAACEDLQNGGSGSGGSTATYAATFADNSWVDIAKACQNNEVPDTWTVGNTKAMTIDGNEYNIQIIGKNHDTYSDGSGTAPLTFQLVELYNTIYKMNDTTDNTTGWSGCKMRTTNLPKILTNMPSDVQSAIKAVDKQTLNGGKTSLEVTSDKLFLLSEKEVFNSVVYSADKAEGSYYDFYANRGSKIKNYGTYGAGYWWLRTPVDNDSRNFVRVNLDGIMDNINSDARQQCVTFAFCF